MAEERMSWHRAMNITLKTNGVEKRTERTVFLVQEGKDENAVYTVYSSGEIARDLRINKGEDRVIAKANMELKAPLGQGEWLSQSQLETMGIKFKGAKVLLIVRDTQ